jgi:DNA-binding NarL/FixJ family response regulator
MDELRVVVADDHALMRSAIRVAIDADDGMTVIAEATSGAEVLEVVKRIAVDVVLLDLAMPPLDGLECVQQLCEQHRDLAVIVLSGSDDRRQIEGALKRGAQAYVVKMIDPSDLPAVIRQTVNGTAFVRPRLHEDAEAVAADSQKALLSERELEVLTHVARGDTNREIAARLWLSEQTVKFHVRNVYRKLGISSRTEALRFAHDSDLVGAAA